MKKHLSKRDPATFEQLYRRWMFFFLQSNWGALELVDKDSWSELADFYEVSNNNAYLGTNMERWDRFEVPGAYLPIQQTGTTGTVARFITVKDNNRIHIQTRLSVVAQNWGIIIYFRYGLPPTHIRQHVIQINLQNDTAFHNFYYYPTSSGYHWFKISLFSHNGERYDLATGRYVNWP